MKSRFPGYFDLEPSELDELWTKAIIVPDTNVLLHFFRNGKTAWEESLGAFASFGDRLAVPHQVGSEVAERWSKIDYAHNGFETAIEGAAAKFNNLVESHRHLRIWSPDAEAQLLKRIADVRAEIKSDIAKAKKADKLDPKEVLSSLVALVEGKLCPSPEAMIVATRTADAVARREMKRPPGWADDAAGDYLIWCEMIDLARARKLPVIFVSDDSAKGDWLTNNTPRQPLPLLRQEFFEKTGQPFWMMTSRQFLERVGETSQSKVSKETIEIVGASAEHEESEPLDFTPGLILEASHYLLTGRKAPAPTIKDLLRCTHLLVSAHAERSRFAQTDLASGSAGDAIFRSLTKEIERRSSDVMALAGSQDDGGNFTYTDRLAKAARLVELAENQPELVMKALGSLASFHRFDLAAI